MIGCGVAVGVSRPRGLERAIRAALFGSGEVGVWYDPSDLTSMFQDSAGTTPVTAVEQPIGLILDRSGNESNATQATTASKPVLRARYNLLTYSEQFDNAIWTKSAVTVTANASSDPIGGATADSIVESTATSAHYALYRAASLSVISGVRYSISIYAKPLASARILQIYPKFSVGGNSGAKFDLVNGTATAVAGTGSGSATIVDVGGGYYRCTFSFTAVASAAYDLFYGLAVDTASALNVSYTGDGVSGVDVWGAQINYGSAASTYQRIAAATYYDTGGFLQAADFDGLDDKMLQSAGGGSTTAFMLCAGLVLDGVGTVQTIWSDTGTNTGYAVRVNASNQLELLAGNGTAYTTAATTDTASAATPVVLTVWDDGTNLNAQINNGTIGSVARPVVSAGTATATIGSSNAATENVLNGKVYQLVQVKNDAGTEAERAATKAYIAGKIGVTL